MNEHQFSMFDGNERLKITKPIRLIELFGGYGSQHFALEYLGAEFEQWKLCEWAVKSIQAYKDAHFKSDNTDYSKDLTKEEIIDYLFSKHISMNYNEPMTFEQIKRLGEQKQRTIYNNIQATHNLVDIQQVKGKDLEIVDADKYCYVMTYSFPCQDLSSAGLGKGMEKGSGTRSGMLWEVERILDELRQNNRELPQVLVMENVPQVHGTKNKESFKQWQTFLVSLGYKNFWQDLNAKNYSIPQNRNRCFMVSILQDCRYDFPKQIPLETKLENLLEDEVDEKYYLSDKALQGCLNTTFNCSSLENRLPKNGVMPTICARDYKDPKLIAEITKSNLKKELCNKLIQNNMVQEGDIIRHSYTNNRLQNGEKNMRRIESKEHLSPTLDTRCDCLGVVVKDVPIACELRSDEGIRTFENNIMGTLRTIDACGNKHIILRTSNKRLSTLVKKMDLSIDNQFMDIYNQSTSNISGTITTRVDASNSTAVYANLRIRKLTPKECFRLMGVKDQDFERIAENQSNASLYHLAGDSIVVPVLMAIFGEMLDIDWQSVVRNFYD